MQGGILSLIATYGTLFAIMGTSTNEFSLMRVGLLAAFSFLQGLNLGPIISYWYVVDMEILVKALAGTAVIFASFTIAGLLDKKGSYMYLGGTSFCFCICSHFSCSKHARACVGFLLSGLNLLVLMQFANIFFRSEMVFELDLYGGLMLFAGFVVYDTQKIMLKAQLGVRDYILDGLTLFLDVVNIFIRILRILGKSKKEEKDNRRRS